MVVFRPPFSAISSYQQPRDKIQKCTPLFQLNSGGYLTIEEDSDPGRVARGSDPGSNVVEKRAGTTAKNAERLESNHGRSYYRAGGLKPPSEFLRLQ